jgi:hypothetical protein
MCARDGTDPNPWTVRQCLRIGNDETVYNTSEDDKVEIDLTHPAPARRRGHGAPLVSTRASGGRSGHWAPLVHARRYYARRYYRVWQAALHASS